MVITNLKRGRGHGIKLSPKEQVLFYFMGFCKEYGWTLEEVKNTDLEDLLNMTVIKNCIEDRPQKYIDQIL